MSKSKSKQEEALQFLDDLDSLTPAQKQDSQPASQQDPAEVLAFLDEITQKSSEPSTKISTPAVQIERPSSRAGTPTLRKTGERVRLGGGTTGGAGASPLKTAASNPSSTTTTSAKDAAAATPEANQGGWGWGSVWSSASAALQQARTVVDEQVKNLPNNEQARKVIEYAKAAQLDKLGQDFKRVGLSTLTDLLNVVAPPISEHEVIQVWLSHDMKGYDGTETLVYRALARIMEQVEGGDLVVNRGNESVPQDSAGSSRELNAVEGYETALMMAEANLAEIIQKNYKPDAKEITESTSVQTPTTYSQVYLRIQPFISSFSVASAPTGEGQSQSRNHLQFLLYLSDPGHQLIHTTITQASPAEWMDMWDEYEWVEDLVAEALRVGVEVVGQEYVVNRMGWIKGEGKESQKGKGKESVERQGSESDVVVVDGKEE